MAATMIPIQSITLTGSAASVTFSGIPQTYTDLVLRMSIRSSATQTTVDFIVTANSITSGYSYTAMRVNSSNSPVSFRASSQASINVMGASDSSATANTFASAEIYVPSYTVAINKPMSIVAAPESNIASGGNGFNTAQAALLSNTAAIASLTINSDPYAQGRTWVAGCTFHLYGIKNS